MYVFIFTSSTWNIPQMIQFRLFIYVILIRTGLDILVFGNVCSQSKNVNRCEYEKFTSELSCAGHSNIDFQNESWYTVNLSLCYWPNEEFNATLLTQFPKIEIFILTRSPVTKILGHFEESSILKVVNISYNAIEYLDPSIFIKLRVLQILDIRFNELAHFNPTRLTQLPNFRALYLVGNKWHCDDNLLWIADKNDLVTKYVMDDVMMICRGPRYNGKPLKGVMTTLQTLKSECSRIDQNCSCVLEHIVGFDNNALRPMISVNCSYQNLTNLPRFLPKHTSTLILYGNKIHNLDEFVTNERYYELFNVYLDHNQISSINVLERSPWLHTFRAFSLKSNNLSEVPIYILEHAFEKNRNIANLFLGGNPWKCDCVFTPPFKDFLIKYRTTIKDVNKVKCALQEGSEYSLAPILSLKQNQVCKEAKSNSTMLGTLNVCMVVILIILLGDFAYNYYVYRKYHKLPWIVNKFF